MSSFDFPFLIQEITSKSFNILVQVLDVKIIRNKFSKKRNLVRILMNDFCFCAVPQKTFEESKNEGCIEKHFKIFVVLITGFMRGLKIFQVLSLFLSFCGENFIFQA